MTVVPFDGVTFGDIPPEKILEAVKEAGYQTVVVVGCGDEGFVLHSSTGDAAHIILSMEIGKRLCLESTTNL